MEGTCRINGEPASVEDLAAIGTTNYGHFTSMRIERGRVRGLELHLERLDTATRELFGHPIDRDRVRGWMREAIVAPDATLTLRVNVFSRRFDRACPSRPAAPDVMISTRLARAPDTQPLRVRSFVHERTLAHVKHVGTFELFDHRRRAQQAGADDALFVDRSGAVSEGSIWNIGFVHGGRIVWPSAPVLRGVSMQLIDRALHARGIETATERVAIGSIDRFRSAFFTNASCPMRAIRCLDDVAFDVDDAMLGIVRDAYASNPLEAI